MSHISPEARAEAGLTKKRRTREKLIHAADYLMRDRGLDATVEAIAKEAHVSVPTFYNFFRSRNHVCAWAFNVLVLDQIQIANNRNFITTAEMFIRLCVDRAALVQATSLWILTEEQLGEEDDGSLPRPPRQINYPFLDPYLDDQFITGRLAYLLLDEQIANGAVPVDNDPDADVRAALAVKMVAVELMSCIAEGRDIYIAQLAQIVQMSCTLPPLA